jgi:probable rRNA maturation factor
MNELTLRNRHPRQRVDLRRLRQIALAALTEPPFAAGRVLHYELAVVLVGATAMARMNGQFLNHAGSTDVITFDYGAPVDVPADAAWLRGDLFICLDDARRQAREFRTSWPAELVRYLVHGLLHLRGYDDLTGAARRVMKRAENRLVRRLARRFALSQLA